MKGIRGKELARSTAGLLWVLLCGQALQGEGGGLLVSPDWLAARLADENLVILYVGAAPHYEAGHIPGASLVELGRISVTSDPGLCVEVPPVEKLREELSRLGIGDQSQIGLYAGTASYQSMTRVFFTLDYIGAGDRASILDGGLALWRSEGRPLSEVATPAAPASLTIRRWWWMLSGYKTTLVSIA